MKKQMKPLSMALYLLAIVLAGCDNELSPIIAGTVHFRSGGNQRVEKPLAPRQIAELTVWIKRSSAKWGRCWATPGPSGDFSILLKHQDGTDSKLSLLSYSNSQTTMMASHLSGTNLADQPCAFQTFTEDEIGELRHLLSL